MFLHLDDLGCCWKLGISIFRLNDGFCVGPVQMTTHGPMVYKEGLLSESTVIGSYLATVQKAAQVALW